MAITPEELELLKEFEDEYGAEGSVPLPTNTVFHWRVRNDGEVIVNEKSGLPRARVPYEVACGPHVGRKWSDFVGWFSNDGDDKTKRSRGFLTGIITNALTFTDAGHDNLYDAIHTMPKNVEVSEANIELAKDGFHTVLEALEGMSIYAKIVESKDGDKNIRYARARDKGAGECECN